MKTKQSRTAKVIRMKAQIKDLKKFVKTLNQATDKHEMECQRRISTNEEACNAMVHVLREQKQVLETKLSNLRLEMQEYKRKKWYQFIER